MLSYKDKISQLNNHERQLVQYIANAKASEHIDKTYLLEAFDVSDETLERLVRLKVLDYSNGEYDIHSI